MSPSLKSFVLLKFQFQTFQEKVIENKNRKKKKQKHSFFFSGERFKKVLEWFQVWLILWKEESLLQTPFIEKGGDETVILIVIENELIEFGIWDLKKLWKKRNNKNKGLIWIEEINGIECDEMDVIIRDVCETYD